MKILPTKGKDLKLFLISLAVAFIYNLNDLLKVGSTNMLVSFLINVIIYSIIIMVVFRIIDWVLTKIKK